jgi:hypothetical protein
MNNNKMSFPIKIYVGVKTEDHKLALDYGAVYDEVKKSYFFQFNSMFDFIQNDNEHTFNFKPYAIFIANMSDVNRLKYMNKLYKVAKQRYYTYMKNKPKDLKDFSDDEREVLEATEIIIDDIKDTYHITKDNELKSVINKYYMDAIL